MEGFYNNHHNKPKGGCDRKKIYRARLDNDRSKVVGWPKAYHRSDKKTVWQTIRAMLF